MSLNSAHEGYDYQDLLTSYFILKEILKGNISVVFSIDKKHTTSNIPDRFDDLVIINDSHIQRKQIKYSNESNDRKLIKNDFANDSKKLALYELYKTWKELNTPESEFRLCLAWDEPTDDNIKSILEASPNECSSFENYSTKLYKVNLENLWKDGEEPLESWRNLKKIVNDNGIDRNDFKSFCDSLIIELELPKASLKFNEPGDLENILIQQAEKLGIGQYPNDDVKIIDFLERLAKKVSEYRTKSAVVSVNKILQDLRIKTDYGKIEQKFDIDQSKNIKFEDKYSSFYEEVKQNKKTLLMGEPGSGKSWFLTNFIEYLEKNSKKVIRHYCFTGTEDEFIEKRVSSNVFFGNLIADIMEYFPTLEKDKRFVSNLNELNKLLNQIDEDLIIIIDGLDHIDRVLKNSFSLSKDKTEIIEHISQIKVPSNISIVLGSQPVEEIKTLLSDFGYKKYILPKWRRYEICVLMSKYSLDDTKIEGKLLSEYIYEKSEGSPLYVTYIIKTFISQEITMEVINSLPPYDFNLKNYYQYLTSQISDNLTSEILSCLEFSVTINELKQINPQSHHIEKDLKILSPVLNENFSRGGIKLYHDSFRRYNIEKLKENNGLQNIYKLIAKWLKKEGFYKNNKAYRYLLGYYIKLKKYKKVKIFTTNDFLTKSLYNGYSESVIKINYDNFLYVAKETQDWELFVYISELNRTIQSTLSDGLNEFEEKFELYFEAIGLIYGFERANSILYFDGKQNFSDELIAKAFYISQKNGYIPNWKKIKHYFKNEITIEKFKYFVAFLIATNKLDENIKKNRIILFENYDYLKILVEEVYYLEGFERILSLYEENKCTHKEVLADKINKILDNTNCTQRILVENKIEHLCLPALNLNFVDDYIKEGVLEEFYYLAKQYSKCNLTALIDFEQTIPSNNFFYNWLKFFIRNFIIEEEINQNKFATYEELEKKFVENFEFLASDIEPFKGRPRAIDLNSNNAYLLVRTIKQAIKYIKSSRSWKKIISCLEKISQGTSAYLQGVQMGILDDRNFIKLLLDYMNNENISYIEKILHNIDNKDEIYSSHLEYKLQKSIFFIRNKKIKQSKRELKQAMKLVTSYTFRKDRTLSEIINPLLSIDTIDKKFAIKYAKKIRTLIDSIEKHTEDGKDIRWLPIEWFEKFIKIDTKLAILYLLDQLLKYPNYWKLEYMFVEYLVFKETKNINPIIRNFLFRLLPTNIQEKYINSYTDNIYALIKIDKKIAYTSLVNILEKDINNSRDHLSHKTLKKLQVLKNILNVSIPIHKLKKEQATLSTFGEKSLAEKIITHFYIAESLKEKSIEEINKYFEKQDRHLSDKDLNFLFNYFNEKKDDKLVQSILEPIITRRFIGDKNYYEKLRELIRHIRCSEELKIYLLVKIFVFSHGGWYENFVNKEALKDAVELNKKQALFYLSQELFEKFKTIYYYSQSTANLIIAFEYAGLKKKHILSMYKRGFEFIEYRLPDDNDFKWESIDNLDLKNMSDDEIAIVMILVKSKNMDAFIQKEIIFAINYLLNYDETLLIKPMQWFFKNITHFPHMFVASILELFLIYKDEKQDFLKRLKDDISKVKNLNNLYISNGFVKLFGSIE